MRHFPRRLLQVQQRRTKYTLPDLPYDFNALEPVISAEIMRLHHQKHHATYVSNLNSALERFEEATQRGDLVAQVALQQQIKFNGGGNLNHSIFWRNLCPVRDAQGAPQGKLAEEIEREFGSFEGFKAHFSAQTAAIQGSGWGWLGFNPVTKRVQFATTSNQDPLQSTTGLIPLLGVDVWEHAYYLQYRNVRPDYLKEIWKIINWEDVSERYHNAIQKK